MVKIHPMTETNKLNAQQMTIHSNSCEKKTSQKKKKILQSVIQRPSNTHDQITLKCTAHVSNTKYKNNISTNENKKYNTEQNVKTVSTIQLSADSKTEILDFDCKLLKEKRERKKENLFLFDYFSRNNLPAKSCIHQRALIDRSQETLKGWRLSKMLTRITPTPQGCGYDSVTELICHLKIFDNVAQRTQEWPWPHCLQYWREKSCPSESGSSS
jgi:hypothetical protein